MDLNMLTMTSLAKCASCSLDVAGAHVCVEPREVEESTFERCVRGIAEERMARRKLIQQRAKAGR